MKTPVTDRGSVGLRSPARTMTLPDTGKRNRPAPDPGDGIRRVAGGRARPTTAPGRTTVEPRRTAPPERRRVPNPQPKPPSKVKRPASERGRRARRDQATRMNVKVRTRTALVVLLALLLAAAVKLVIIQGVDGSALAATGAGQLTGTERLYATRGSITDRAGNPLAFSIQGDDIAAYPARFKTDGRMTAQQRRQEVADMLVAALGTAVDRQAILRALASNSHYVYLAKKVLPDQANTLVKKIVAVLGGSGPAAVVTEAKPIRQTPAGSVTSSLVGTTDPDGNGLAGIESKFNALLAGKDGSKVFQVDGQGNLIAGTDQEVPNVNGTNIQLTLDSDLQYTLDQMLRKTTIAEQAASGRAVITDARTDQVLAMDSYTPGQAADQTSNPDVTTPFEPGSVNKIVTFAAALDAGVITPSMQFDVPGEITLGGTTVHDAWSHDPVEMTATGILGKSSNVGTLMIAQKLGQARFAAQLAKFGLGRKTGIELPGESAGSYPNPAQWSSATFDNLPIGQGIQMTMVQLTAMYQAIANGGVMVEPTIIASTTTAGKTTQTVIAAGTRVMKASTAATLKDMLRGPVQGGDWYDRGTAPGAAIAGYQVAGKTGTAQQVDPACSCYSQTKFNESFVGIVPADHPKFIVSIMMDAPKAGSEGGTSAAPLFHEIASYALRAYDVAPSTSPAPVYDLYVR